MNTGSRIIAIGSESSEEAPAPEAFAPPAAASSDDFHEGWSEETVQPVSADHAWLLPLLAFMAIAGWTALFISAQDPAIMVPAPAARWVELITGWSVPVLLIAVVWLLAMRNSRREAVRFGAVASLLSSESENLEMRLTAINRELSLAREFIAAQGRDLDSLGRLAVDRLSQNADRLQSLIHDNGAQVTAISTVSTAALENMDRLRDQLPVIASSAKDVTNNIGNAGRIAQAQLQEMISGFKRLNEFGQACERQVMSLRDGIATSLGEFTRQAEQLDVIASERFAALEEGSASFREQLGQQEAEALAAIRSRAAAMSAELAEARGLLDSQEAESLFALRARLNAVRDESGVIGRSLREAQDASLQGWRDQLAQLDHDVRETLALLERTDADAIAAAQSRMGILMGQAEMLETSFAEQTGRLADALARRGAEIERQDSAALAHLAERFGQFDMEAAKREEVFAAGLRQRADEAETRQDAAMAKLRSVLDTLDSEIEIRVERQAQLVQSMVARSDTTLLRLAQLEEKIAEVSLQGTAAEERLAAGLQALANRIHSGRDALSGSEMQIDALTDSSVRLLELIQAGVKHSTEDLPAALITSETKLTAIEQRIFMLRDTVDEAGTRGQKLSDYVQASNEGLGIARQELAALDDVIAARNSAHSTVLQDIQTRLAAVDAQSRELADHARSELSAAIAQLETSAREALSGIQNLSAETIGDIAARLGEQSGEAIDRAMRARAAEVAGQLEQAAAHAAGISREAATQLRDQLAKVGELTANLERRVAHARERAEEQVNNDFARRIALINESLNSNAIDIAKAISTDVSDTAWAAYLRGDRGIFTRRAVNLIDTGEARPIAQLYENDHDFREHVSRYIHDFEAMLRQLLSTRDGHAIGVTLLSSDMGKLYVALAQSIERLRA